MNGILFLIAVICTAIAAALFGPYAGGSLPANLAFLTPFVPVIFWIAAGMAFIVMLAFVIGGLAIFVGPLAIAIVSGTAWSDVTTLPLSVAFMAPHMPFVCIGALALFVAIVINR